MTDSSFDLLGGSDHGVGQLVVGPPLLEAEHHCDVVDEEVEAFPHAPVLNK